jgi:hypothetical protein
MAEVFYLWGELRNSERTPMKIWLRAQLQAATNAGDAVLVRRWRIIIRNVLPEWERQGGE